MVMPDMWANMVPTLLMRQLFWRVAGRWLSVCQVQRRAREGASGHAQEMALIGCVVVIHAASILGFISSSSGPFRAGRRGNRCGLMSRAAPSSRGRPAADRPVAVIARVRDGMLRAFKEGAQPYIGASAPTIPRLSRKPLKLQFLITLCCSATSNSTQLPWTVYLSYSTLSRKTILQYKV